MAVSKRIGKGEKADGWIDSDLFLSPPQLLFFFDPADGWEVVT
jgi:hypothetical protein